MATNKPSAMVPIQQLNLQELEARLTDLRQRKGAALREIELEEQALNQRRIAIEQEAIRKRQALAKGHATTIKEKLSEIEKLMTEAGFTGGFAGKIGVNMGWTDDIEVDVGEQPEYGWHGSNC